MSFKIELTENGVSILTKTQYYDAQGNPVVVPGTNHRSAIGINDFATEQEFRDAVDAAVAGRLGTDLVTGLTDIKLAQDKTTIAEAAKDLALAAQAATEAAKATAEAERDAAQAAQAAAEAARDTAQAENNTVKAERDAANASIDTLNAEIVILTADRDALMVQISDLEAQIAALQSQL